MTRIKTQALRVPVLDTRRTAKQVNSDSWRGLTETSAQRGYGYRWQKARLAHLAREPLCRYCAKAGRVTEATVVDHIEPHRGDMVLFWKPSNWQSLCAPCHSGTKQREERKNA